MEVVREVHAEHAAMLIRYVVAVGDDILASKPLCVVESEEWDSEGGQHFRKRREWLAPFSGTVEACLIERNTAVAKGEPMAKIRQKCSHDVQLHGLCALCGADLVMEPESQHATISMLHGVSGLTVSEKEAQRLEQKTVRHLLQEKKLTLVLDLDQTLIHASVDPAIAGWLGSPSGEKDETSDRTKEVYAFQLPESPLWYYIKLRPKVREFLSHVKQFYELHIYTMGTRAYATHVARVLDPTQDLFRERILSRDDCPDMTFKSLRRLFPFDDSMVVIMDDRADIWQWCRNLIKVSPYNFFVGAGDINAPALVSTNKTSLLNPGTVESTEEREIVQGLKQRVFRPQGDEDGSLFDILAQVLNRLHMLYYSVVGAMSVSDMDSMLTGQQIRREADIKTILPQMKQQVLSQVHILFSGVIPRHQVPETHELWILAELFGAVCHQDFDEQLTHVIASQPGTCKVKQALSRPNLFIVHIDWLTESLRQWKRLEEQGFPVSDTPVSTSSCQNDARPLEQHRTDLSIEATAPSSPDQSSAESETEATIDDPDEDPPLTHHLLWGALFDDNDEGEAEPLTAAVVGPSIRKRKAPHQQRSSSSSSSPTQDQAEDLSSEIRDLDEEALLLELSRHLSED